MGTITTALLGVAVAGGGCTTTFDVGESALSAGSSTGEPPPAESSTAAPPSLADSTATGDGAEVDPSRSDDSGDGVKLDVASPDEPPPPQPPPVCTVSDPDVVRDCVDRAPPNSFEPDIQWVWEGQDGQTESSTAPLVANLTDDDGNGTIDLCDVPDVVVNALNPASGQANLYVLDGATGAVHWKSEERIDRRATPALGDIDGDGEPEIVAVGSSGRSLIAFEADGRVAWVGEEREVSDYTALALADLDNDGDVEILFEEFIFDHLGQRVITLDDFAGVYLRGSAPAAADLDGDGDLEVILGRSAFHHDGGVVYKVEDIQPGFPHVANLDDDPEPEVLVQSTNGLSMFEHDGTVKFLALRPSDAAATNTNWTRPATIHDFDGDGISEFASSSSTEFSVYERDASIRWSAPVLDGSGSAAGTAFDFLGDGKAEAMYADESSLFVFDEEGSVLMQVPRSSSTINEYPIVADVDNDGSAEILVVSSSWVDGLTAPLLQVIRDVDDRWIQARRIWNQHTYHVTNVREDGTIPAFEAPSWERFNTFRTNAQIENGELCTPPPAG